MISMNKIHLIFLCYFLVCFFDLQGQVLNDSNYKDPFALLPGLRNHYSLSFLIKEDTVYCFEIIDVFKRKEGRIIKSCTSIDSLFVYAYILVPNEKWGKFHMKKGDKCKMSVRRYFFMPEMFAYYKYFIGEHYAVSDVVTGNTTWSFSENGMFSYLFVISPEENVRQEFLQNATYKSALYDCLRPFVSFLTYDADEFVSDYLDTLSMKKCFQRYGCVISKLEMGVPKTEKELLGQPKSAIVQQKGYWKNKRNSFKEFFHDVQKEYGLPVKRSEADSLFYIDSLYAKLLYYGPRDIYTFQVFWKERKTGKKFVAVVNLQFKQNQFKIIGINKPYDEYNRLNQDYFQGVDYVRMLGYKL